MFLHYNLQAMRLFVPALMVFFLLLVSRADGKDPAQGWMGYAKATSPTGSGVITYIEATWKNLNNPAQEGAFFSPWFGIETSDNMNLIQPVNPWVGGSWEIYNEYFQWSPVNNYDSESHTTRPGDILFGSVTFDEKEQVYHMFHKDLTDGWSVNSTIRVEKDFSGNYKQYTIAYFVMEKVWPCEYYPPDEEVTFENIKIEYDGKRVKPVWTTAYVDDNCQCRAHIKDEDTVSITWTTQA